MEFPIFEQDSCFDRMHRNIEWLKDSTPIDLIELDQNDSDPNYIDVQSISFANLNYKQPSNEGKISYRQPAQQIWDQNQQNQDASNPTEIYDSKSKKIFQRQKHEQNNSTQKNNLSANLKLTIALSNKSKSKYNNMGGFLIGTFSQILQINTCYRFDNGWLQMYINGTWDNFQKMDSYDIYEVERSLACLKDKIFNLSRKDGAKKHLFDIINSEPSDSQLIKISKCIIRKQLIHGLSQEHWLLNHVESRDFKPSNDDFLGTKKKKRHDDYLTYLKAIKYSLQIRGCIPKRIQV